MSTSRQTKIRSVVVLIVAALLIELTTAVQYWVTRRGIAQQITEMAQRDFNATSNTAELKAKVETTVQHLLPEVERLTNAGNIDSVCVVVKQCLQESKEIVGVDFCLKGQGEEKPHGIYIYKDEDINQITHRTIDFDFTKRSWYQKGIESDAFWSEPYKSHYRISWMCTFARAVRNAEGSVVGVIGADVPMSEISALATGIYNNQQQSLFYIILIHVFGLGVLAFIIQRAISSESHLHEVEAEKESIKNELTIARDIQLAMVPKMFPAFPERSDVDVYASLTPAKEVGGDLYDFLIRDEKLFFCVGDVSGKGVPSALVMAMACSVFRMLCAREAAPDRIVTAMNDTMAADNEYNMFITLFVGVLDLPTGRLRYCNAGHPAPLINGVPLEANENLAVGVFPGGKFKMRERKILYGDTIFLFTDGLNEAMNQEQQLFGKERMTDICLRHAAEAKENPQKASPQSLINTMFEAVNSYVGEVVQSDDLTLMAIRYSRQQLDARLHCDITLECNIDEVPKLADFVDSVCFALNLSPSLTMQMNLAIEEAVVNVINYAYPAGSPGKVNVEATANDQKLKFVITDTGKPFDPTTRGNVDTSLPVEERNIGGLGIHLIRKYMDSINYEREDGKNILTLRKQLDGSTNS